MWFKQMQLLQLSGSIDYSSENLINKLTQLEFRSCLPSMPTSMGWVSPIDEENEPLVLVMNNYIMLCLQFEEKILPSSVIRQELNNKIKQIEMMDARKIRQKEKLAFKDEIVITLLPRAFSKITRLYAYIDIKNNWLVLNTVSAKKTEQFISIFKKSISEEIHSFELKKLAPIATHWLKHQNYPSTFSIEKKCTLQDPSQQNRVIRCQEQDLFANSIQSLIKDGCEVKQLALSWQDRVSFMLSADDFSLRSIKYEEEITLQAMEMEAETKKQQYIADFFIMTATLSQLLAELQQAFTIEVKKLDMLVA